MKKQLNDSVLRKLYKSGLTFLKPTNVQKLYPTLVEEAKKLVKAEDGLIVIKENKSWKVIYASSAQAAQVAVRGKGYTFQALKNQKAKLINASDFAKNHPEIVKQGLRSALFIPLTYEDTSIGVLILRSYDRKSFTNQELKTLQLFGSMASLSMHKAQLYEKLSKAVATRDLFLAMASHELRTPLTTLKMYVQFIEKSVKTSRPIDNSLVNKLSATTSRIALLVEDMLQANYIRSGNLPYSWEPCSIKEIVDLSLESVQMNNPKYNISYSTTVLPLEDIILADKNRLMQVIINILNNAVKFSPPTDKIQVSLLQNSHHFILSISDTGPGIAEKDLDNIFTEFYKGERNHKEGMGLGLFLAKSIVEAHKGKIEIQTKLHQGTTVTIFLPQEQL